MSCLFKTGSFVYVENCIRLFCMLRLYYYKIDVKLGDKHKNSKLYTNVFQKYIKL